VLPFLIESVNPIPGVYAQRCEHRIVVGTGLASETVSAEGELHVTYQTPCGGPIAWPDRDEYLGLLSGCPAAACDGSAATGRG